MLSADRLAAYKRALDVNKQAALRRLEEYIRTVRVDPDDIEAAREAFIDFFEGLEASYGDAAASMAADLFEDQLRDAGLKPDGTRLAENPTDKVREDAARIFDNGLKGAYSGGEGFAHAAGMALGTWLHRRANETMRRNAARRGVRYARVPTGPETCGFCILLASRGFVYGSRRKAGDDGNHYHPNCDCLVVAGFGEDPRVEGYDPDYYKDIYDRNIVTDGRGRVDLKGTVASIRQELMGSDEYREHVNETRRAYYRRNRDRILKVRHDWIERTGRNSRGEEM